ncbi:acetyl-CoA acetyltransferase [Sphingobium sp. TA15]|uniref:Acetyl-CoA acyltransferase n=2 Tax=Sphingobium indicum TaxID=332055 RepID=D4Z8E1_SPHIU|nr:MULTISPECIES: acetyl-CoA C-acetyltransferase [Sphingobium]EPR15210.1 acetyl-CoA acetyltransferase [Sphingobium indicum IP26]BDD68808.1 acetyl-CoA acetyltransferase [Sphingobium sp. TA15]EQB03054.1 acetyl-CoA acetyltransferase [Sphingobium sp. HDIP04]KER34952.1 acetyl-CoA acetyltransferase [Sphingobium indicum F2]BAI98760.1 acetyl-CoA acyltransferase [Sphingobium indicum UT26S]
MPEAFIFDAVRTPRGRGKPDGSLHEISALELAAQTLGAIRDRHRLDTSLVDDVILGCVMPVGEQGADIARLAVLAADYAQSTAGVQVNRFCGSGLEACNMAAAKVVFGEAEFAIGGGVESMSRVAMGADGGAMAVDPSFAYDSYFTPQGIGADLIATLDGFSREDVDGYAVESQRRAARAWAEGRFSRSVVPVVDQAGVTRLDHDEHIRADATIDSLATLKPSFKAMGETLFDPVAIQRYPEISQVDHVHHAGNSSGIVDGASAVLIGSREAGEKAGLKPRAKILGAASIGSEPTIMLTGPSYVTEKLLKRLGMAVADIDLFELNEAFAAVVLRYMKMLDIPHDKINVNGGAIAMGHPLGATGGMILGTVLDELERSGKETAVINLCVGAGMGTAMAIARV